MATKTGTWFPRIRTGRGLRRGIPIIQSNPTFTSPCRWLPCRDFPLALRWHRRSTCRPCRIYKATSPRRRRCTRSQRVMRPRQAPHTCLPTGLSGEAVPFTASMGHLPVPPRVPPLAPLRHLTTLPWTRIA